MKKLKISVKIPENIYFDMLDDLRRSHPFSFERVGFLFTLSKTINDTILILGVKYQPVADEDYINDDRVGAKLNSTAIRKSMQEIFDNKFGCFHVHLHNHPGPPNPSSTDLKELPKVVKSFSNISGTQINGFIILSNDSFYTSIQISKHKKFIEADSIICVGYPMKFQFNKPSKKPVSKVYDRQSFLGETGLFNIENVRVSIVGYGGGGSHIGQQLAHLGVKHITVFDSDRMEDSNINRLVGAFFSDIKNKTLKALIAKRVIKKILPNSSPNCIPNAWQDFPEIVQKSDIVFGCVDSYSQRQQLEAECRRYLIPYIDIGMDVNESDDDSYSISGQVILSMPGAPCMTCFGYLTEEKLTIEGKRYGKTGNRPQVVWPNGVLASSAVGIFIDLVSGWSKQMNRNIYLAYDGNTGIVSDHIRLRFTELNCTHYPLSEVGEPKFRKL
jgi:ThiF family